MKEGVFCDLLDVFKKRGFESKMTPRLHMRSRKRAVDAG